MSGLLTSLIDDAADREPDREAVVFLDGKLTYRELRDRSNRLANLLVANGVRKGDRVGIYMDKRLETAVAMYGIMKSGAAYVPVDPAAPPERFAALVNDCGMRHLVSAPDKRRRLRNSAGATGIECVIGTGEDGGLPYRCLPWDAVDEAGGEAPDVTKTDDDLAYIIYTSGSTGKPKGIMHTHHSGLSFARWAAAEYGLRPEDRLSNHAPLHFDLSIFDYFAGAAAGATTVIVPEEYTKLPASYSQLLADQRVTVLFTVPFALIQLLLRGMLDERDLGRLRWIIFGGEPFPTKHLRALMRKLDHVRFDNMYGPAEVNGCTHFTADDPDIIGDSVPIGPISSIARALVVDSQDGMVPAGEIGELLVCTPTMMRGYWARPDLDEQAFFSDPASGGVYYRTGDLVTASADGVFEFVGRKDRQIKVRGYRVELDEVESALASHDRVEEAAAFAVPDGEGSQAIVGAVTLKQSAAVTLAELIAHAKASLPWYAVPGELTIRERFPRTTTGKIDRRNLRDEAMRAC
jgi:amino acid adenylation domain-containing protein